MTFKPKPIISPAPEHRREVLDIVHEHLLIATDIGATEIGSTGASFVVIGMGLWTAELAAIDGQAAAKYLRALADIFDPMSDDSQRQRAQEDRSQAVRDIYAAVDFHMAVPEGNA